MNVSSTCAVGILAAATLLLGGCGEPRSAIDTVPVGPEDDVFIGQTPYALDHSVVVLRNCPPAVQSDGAIVLTGGRELVVVTPNAWRGYTGTAMTTEEADRRIRRANNAAAASRRLSTAVTNTDDALEDLTETLQRTYDPHYRPAAPVRPKGKAAVANDTAPTPPATVGTGTTLPANTSPEPALVTPNAQPAPTPPAIPSPTQAPEAHAEEPTPWNAADVEAQRKALEQIKQPQPAAPLLPEAPAKGSAP
jgi:hypothetical protein